MHRHLHLVRAVAEPQRPEHQRPAKVVQLEARRQARLEAQAARAEQAQAWPRPAA
jgi:hypothetical protein